MASSTQARFVLIDGPPVAPGTNEPALAAGSPGQRQDGPLPQPAAAPASTPTDQASADQAPDQPHPPPSSTSPVPPSTVPEQQQPPSGVDANGSELPPPPPPPPPSAGMAPTKPPKKGTATAKKPPSKKASTTASSSTAPPSSAPKAKKPRSSGTKRRTGGPRPKKSPPAASTTTTHVISEAALNIAADLAGGDDDDEDVESDNGPYCICRGPDDHRWMIACEACDDWFHGECVNLSADIGENLIDRFICPGCELKHPGLRTRYKLTCSLDGCTRPARLYSATPGPDGKAVALENDDDDTRSAFCSDTHRDAWWAHWLARVPEAGKSGGGKSGGGGGGFGGGAALTREQMLALLTGKLSGLDEQGNWKLLQPPLGGDGADACEPWMLTAEEGRILARSERERDDMSADAQLCQQMLRLLDMAQERRCAAVAVKLLSEDGCGYDAWLDAVGTKAAFREWAAGAAGEAVFAAGELDGLERDGGGSANEDGDVVMADGDADVGGGEGGGNVDGVKDDGSPGERTTAISTRGMCLRRRCKPHMSWQKVLTRTVKMQMRELGSGVAARLGREEEIKSAAVGRAKRRAVDPGHVEVVQETMDEGGAGV